MEGNLAEVADRPAKGDQEVDEGRYQAVDLERGDRAEMADRSAERAHEVDQGRYPAVG